MDRPFKIAKCPCCVAVIPLDVNGTWIEHTAHYKLAASYTCPGSGETPHADSVSTIVCCDEPKK